MFKFITIGLLGGVAAIGGIWLNQFLNTEPQEEAATAGTEAHISEVKTEMTGIPIVTEGNVSGYLVFQISSTIDSSKLVSREFDVKPYILDAAIRSSYQSTEAGLPKFNGVYLSKLAALVRTEANTKLSSDAVLAVNVEQFNFVPKGEIRGNVLFGHSTK